MCYICISQETGECEQVLEDNWQFLPDDSAAALKAFSKATELKPDNALAWRGRGMALLGLGKLGQALDALNGGANTSSGDAVA